MHSPDIPTPRPAPLPVTQEYGFAIVMVAVATLAFVSAGPFFTWVDALTRWLP